MYKHILVPTDGSPLSLKAARTAARLAAPLKAKITTVYVSPPYPPPISAEGIVYHQSYSEAEYARDIRKVAKRATGKVEAAAGKVACVGISAVGEHPWKAIIEVARSKKCDLIVMASHGRRGLAGLLLGSETQKVLTHSKTPVLVCR
jgi:nucleotide-binding universal stress UspA family protein